MLKESCFYLRPMLKDCFSLHPVLRPCWGSASHLPHMPASSHLAPSPFPRLHNHHFQHASNLFSPTLPTSLHDIFTTFLDILMTTLSPSNRGLFLQETYLFTDHSRTLGPIGVAMLAIYSHLDITILPSSPVPLPNTGQLHTCTSLTPQPREALPCC